MSIITLILGVVVFGSASLTGMPLEGQMRTAWTGC